MKVRVAALFLLSALFGTPSVAAAGPAEPTPAAEVERARILYVEGLEARRDGDLLRSLERLKEAHATYPTPITAFEHGKALSLLGRMVEARDVLRSVAEMSIRANESDKARAARHEAAQLAEAVSARVVTVIPKVENAPSSEVVFAVDGVRQRPLGPEGLAVDPGRHLISAESMGSRAESFEEAEEGHRVELRLKFAQAPTPPSAPATAPGARAQSKASPSSSAHNTVMLAGFGTAAVATVVAAVTGVMTMTRSAELQRVCTNGSCPEGSGLATTQTLATITDVAALTAGAAFLIGGFAWITAPRAQSVSRPTVQFGVGPSGLLVQGGF